MLRNIWILPYTVEEHIFGCENEMNEMRTRTPEEWKDTILKSKGFIHKETISASKMVKPLSSGNWSEFPRLSCPSEKGGAHRWKETGINWPNSLSNQSLCFASKFDRMCGPEWQMSPSNWLDQNGQSGRLSGNDRSSCHSSSHLMFSFYQRQYWHLYPHYLQLTAMYAPFICCCRSSEFLYYSSIYTRHLLAHFLPPTHHTPMARTRVTQRCQFYQHTL